MNDPMNCSMSTSCNRHACARSARFSNRHSVGEDASPAAHIPCVGLLETVHEGRPIIVRYDLRAVGAAVSRDDLKDQGIDATKPPLSEPDARVHFERLRARGEGRVRLADFLNG